MHRNGTHTIRRVWDATGTAASATGLEGYVAVLSGAAGKVNRAANATVKPVGIITKVAEDGLSVDIALPDGVCNARYGAAVAANAQKLMADATGRLITYVAAAGNYCAGWHLTGATAAAADMYEVQVKSRIDHND